MVNKDLVLKRGRNGGADVGGADGERRKDKKTCRTAASEFLESSVGKWSHAKQSINHALNTSKSHLHSDTHMHLQTLELGGAKRPPSLDERASPLEDYMFYTPACKLDEKGSKDEDDS